MRKIVVMSMAVLMIAAATAWGAATPAVVTSPATSVSNSGARVNAFVNPEGSRTSYLFQYGLNTLYGSLTKLSTLPSGTKGVKVSALLAGLNPGTTYHYRIEATNQFGSAFGADRTFTTSGFPPPGAITGVATAVGKTTATLNGIVFTQNQTTSVYFQYGTTTNYGYQTASQNATAAATATGVFYTLTGLAPGTTFHFRLVAIHPGGAPEYGADVAVTTVPQVPLRARVTARTTPVRARRAPAVFTTLGTVIGPRSLPAGVGCRGAVTVRFVLGRRVVAARRVSVQANCTYSAQIRFRHLIHRTRTRPTVEVRFDGNAYLHAVRARAYRVTLG